MSDLIVSLNKNLLNLTYFGSEGFGGSSVEVSADTVEDSKIKDVGTFCEVLSGLIQQVIPPKAKNMQLSFLIEPQNSILEFATVTKTNGGVEEQILSVVGAKLPKGVVFENLYYSYQKIAPFVYQFVGIKQGFLGKYLEVSAKLDFPLKAVVPWVLLLPRLVNDNQPSIFISNAGGRQAVVLAELNGVYFSGVYEKEKSQEELAELVQTLSVYKRVVPINKIYTVGCDSFTLDPNYQVLPIEMSGGDLSEAKGYETHLLFSNVVSANSSVLSTQINALNLLPVPVVEKQPMPALKVGGLVVSMLLLVGGGLFLWRSRSGSIENLDPAAEVLSETTEVDQSSETVSMPEPMVDVVTKEVVTEVVKLNKENLSIRVENGSGVVGDAGKARDFFEDLGYTVISIGDADETGLERTTLQFKDASGVYKDMVIEDIADSYSAVVMEEVLDESVDYDVLVVVGLE